jgi:acetyl esterase/lipase
MKLARSARRAAFLAMLCGLTLFGMSDRARSLFHLEPWKPRPQHVNVRYGPDKRHVLDLWKARTASKHELLSPLVVFFHGGGFCGGDKGSIPAWLVARCLKAGISIASVNYRLAPKDPFPAPMLDGARVVQFLRYRAEEFGLDPRRFAASGSSAGAGIALWVGFHDDLADPASPDPVARQSSRVQCLGVDGAQTSYDPRFIKALIGGRAHEHPALRPFYGMRSDADLDAPEACNLYQAASPLSYASADDPPVILFYDAPDGPLRPDGRPGDGIHHPRFGAALAAKLDPLGVPCVRRHLNDYPAPAERNEVFSRDMVAFLAEKLRLSPGEGTAGAPPAVNRPLGRLPQDAGQDPATASKLRPGWKPGRT